VEAFGVNFRIGQPELYQPLVAIFEELKRAKVDEDFGEVDAWASKLAEPARSCFYWPTPKEQEEWSALRESHPVVITQPEDALGQQWDFGSFLDAIANGEYSLLEIVKTSDSTAELRIDPEAYPYGGIGAFVALVEAYGMHVLGVNEYGKYQTRHELRPEEKAFSKRPWWKLWQ
jgi:hypothetical protein